MIDYNEINQKLSKRNEELHRHIEALNLKLKAKDEIIDGCHKRNRQLCEELNVAETCIQFIDLIIELWYETDLEDLKSQPFICQIYNELLCFRQQSNTDHKRGFSPTVSSLAATRERARIINKLKQRDES